MNETTSFERRLAALVGAYADRAPTDVDPVATARFAAGGRISVAAGWIRPTPMASPAAWVVIAAAMLATLVGGLLLAGGASRPLAVATASPAAPAGTPRGLLGLPPPGATPSLPGTGRLVLSYLARAKDREPCCGMLRVWLYEDGRLISERESDANTPVLADPPMLSTGLYEQRLMPSGVEQIRADALAALPSRDDANVFSDGRRFFWGGLRVQDRTQLVDLTWQAGGASWDPRLTDAQEVALLDLDRELRYPEQVLPASAWAWADPEPRAYVASRYAVCLFNQSLVRSDLDVVPAPAAALLRERGGALPEEWETCWALTTEDTRSLVTMLEASGYQDEEALGSSVSVLTYRPPAGRGAGVDVEIDPILPGGERCCRGG